MGKGMKNLERKDNFSKKDVQRLKRITSSTKQLKRVMNLEELLQHLIELNLTIINKEETSKILEEMGYFKFSGYRKIFLTTFLEGSWSGKYEDGATDRNVIALMQLNTDLSKLLFEFVSIIEIKLKARTAYFISMKYGSDAYLNKEIFTTEEKWKKFIIERYFRTIDKEKRNEDPIVIHHISKYDSKLPIWALFDKISLDAFLDFLQILNDDARDATFKDIFCSSKTYYNLNEYGYDKSYPQYLKIIKYVRNRVCHYDRIIDYKHKFSPKENKFKSDFNQTFARNEEGFLYLSDIVQLMGCFLNEKEFKLLRKKYKERINHTIHLLPINYQERLLSELGTESLKNK